MQSAKKVVFNTGVLYFRMFITVGFTLYCTRLVLNALGEIDYGIFNLIAGIVALLSFLNAAMSISTQRYFSFHQGTKDVLMQKKIFRNSFVLHVLLGFVIVAMLEIAGLFLFSGFLNIPENRLATAKIVFHFISGTVFFTVLSVPFTGMLNAHEDMMWEAIVIIIETFLKFGLALFLFVVTGDRLIVYGFLMSIITIFSFLLYFIYCFRKYDECTMSNLLDIDTSLIKDLTSFAGWNLFGVLSWLGRTQGLAVLLNVFFGAVVNAAYGISNQVSAQLNFFSATMLRAINPQIMKSEGANDRERMLRLSMIASKFCFFLLSFIAIPCIFEMPTILRFWLKDVPEHTIEFCTLMLIGTLINQLTIGLQSAIQATGKIKLYQIVVGTTLLLNLPVAYMLLKLGYSLYSILISYLFIEFSACMLRLYIVHKLAGLSIKEYFSRVFFKELIPLISSILTCFAVTTYMKSDFRLFVTGMLSVSVFSISIYFTGLCKDEKEILINIIHKVLRKRQALKPDLPN